jgi:chloride channel protein, CIC family
VITRHDLQRVLPSLPSHQHHRVRLADMLAKAPIVAHPDEPLRLVVNRMAATGLTRFPVVKQDDKQDDQRELVGLIGLQDLLKARELSVATEHHRERVLRLRVPSSLRWRGLRSQVGEGPAAPETTAQEPVVQHPGSKDT